MRCSLCTENAVYGGLCGRHFIQRTERTVKATIKRFSLIRKNDRILVATSGGKDSLSLLHMLSSWYDDVSALAIDEGIEGYRPTTLRDLKAFCKERGTKLKVVSFEDEYGRTLDQMLTGGQNPCTQCGTLRRSLINRHSRGYDVLATGHNMDDEAQSVLMNVMLGNPLLNARLGPKTGLYAISKFTPRVKPFYFISEREIKLYSILKRFGLEFVECPYVEQAFRQRVGSMLNSLERSNPGTKRRVLDNFLKDLPRLKSAARKMEKEEEIAYCEKCGEPSRKEICNACLMATRT